MNFDDVIDRRGSQSTKWDKMEKLYGVSPDNGLAMWVADMDFRSAECILQAAQDLVDLGNFGYGGDDDAYRAAIVWWMQNRHGWQVDPSWIFTTTGLVNAIGLCLDTFTAPGDGVILFTPVYHSFARVIKAAGRQVVDCPLLNDAGRYCMDFAAYDAQMTGAEKALILCSPHNPGGRVWTREELLQVADFAKRHDLLLISDEIHHDLIYPGHKHIPMPLADPSVADRLIMLTAPSKTFNVAGNHTGNTIIPDPALRERFEARMHALSIANNIFGVRMTTAAYSPEGAEWVDALMTYLDRNRRTFDSGLNAVSGVRSMLLEGAYLAWVDFSGIGMDAAEIQRRVQGDARIAANHGATFGPGGEAFLRFNLGTQHAHIEVAVERLQAAFADLQ